VYLRWHGLFSNIYHIKDIPVDIDMVCNVFVPFVPTGPLLPENLDVALIPLEQIRDLSEDLCGKDVVCLR